MRVRLFAVVVLVVAAGLAGCTARPDGGTDTALPLLCPAPCERLVDGGPERAFEPDIAIDPTDDRHWFVGSTVFHDSDEVGTPLSLKAHVTFDGGATWQTSDFPGSVSPEHPMAAYTHSGDPAVAVLDDGTVLYAGMFGTGVIHPTGADGTTAFRPFDIVVARSTDGGVTFSEFTVIDEGVGVMGSPPGNPFPGIFLVGEWPDHPWIAAGQGGRVLLTYQLRTAQGGPPTFVPMTVVSADGGRTWTEPTPVRTDGSFGNLRPVVRDDGTFWMSYRDLSVEPRYVLTASSKDGRMWDSRVVEGVRTGWYQDSAVRGTDLWLVVVPGEEGGVETVQAMRSADAGLTWTAIEVDHAEAEGFSMPRVAAGPEGVVVTYYLHRESGTEYRAALVSDDRTVERLVLSSSSIGRNEFLGKSWAKFGDYVGLDATGTGFAAAWVSGDGSDADVQAAFVPWRTPMD